MKKISAMVLFAFALVFLAAPTAGAADRVHAGQWETTMTIPGVAKAAVTKHCTTAAEAALMNGDLPTLRKYVEQSTAKNTKGRCSVKSVAIDGNRTIVTIACGKTEVVGTTTYHGDRYESSSSNGTKIVGKRVGACP
jgi:NADPH-dependent 2,4-dienoyl-CoA reductase/sulfur reductase-like enzyme